MKYAQRVYWQEAKHATFEQGRSPSRKASSIPQLLRCGCAVVR